MNLRDGSDDLRIDGGDLHIVARSAAGQRAPALAAVSRPPARYEVHGFVARYAAVWAYGVVGVGALSEPYYQWLVQVASEVRLPEAGATVLEVGCGPGRVIGDLAARLPSARCVGIDASAIMIDVASSILLGESGTGVVLDAGDYGFASAHVPARGLDNVELAHRTLEEQACSGDVFDFVVASHLLDRVMEPTASLADLVELVAPGGTLLVTCAFNFEHRHQWTLRSGKQISQMLTAAGFEIDVLQEAFPYRELLDARGTWTEHKVALVLARRPGRPGT